MHQLRCEWCHRYSHAQVTSESHTHRQILSVQFCMPSHQAELEGKGRLEKAEHSLVRECAAFYFCLALKLMSDSVGVSLHDVTV